MSEYLPFGRFKWSKQEEIDRSDMNAVSKNKRKFAISIIYRY